MVSTTLTMMITREHEIASAMCSVVASRVVAKDISLDVRLRVEGN